MLKSTPTGLSPARLTSGETRRRPTSVVSPALGVRVGTHRRRQGLATRVLRVVDPTRDIPAAWNCRGVRPAASKLFDWRWIMTVDLSRRHHFHRTIECWTLAPSSSATLVSASHSASAAISVATSTRWASSAVWSPASHASTAAGPPGTYMRVRRQCARTDRELIAQQSVIGAVSSYELSAANASVSVAPESGAGSIFAIATRWGLVLR